MFPQLKTLVAKVHKEYETDIDFTCPIDQYDEWMTAYKANISDFVSKNDSKERIAWPAAAFTNRFDGFARSFSVQSRPFVL